LRAYALQPCSGGSIESDCLLLAGGLGTVSPQQLFEQHA
jgi:hypothetical protein